MNVLLETVCSPARTSTVHAVSVSTHTVAEVSST